MSQSIAAAKFKEQCLALLDKVGPEGIIITKHGRAVARLVPVQKETSDLIGSLKGKLIVKGEVFSAGLSWDAES